MKLFLNVLMLSLMMLIKTHATADQFEIQKNTSSTQLKQSLEELFNEHGSLLNQAIVNAWQNEPAHVVEEINQKLFKNAKQIADLFTSLYGQDVGQDFERLFRQHILLGGDYINAIKYHNQTMGTQVANKALDNGRMLARFFANLYPSTPYSTWQALWEKHVMLEAQQTVAYFKNDTVQANGIKQQTLIQLKEIADAISTAIDRLKNSNDTLKTSINP